MDREIDDGSGARAADIAALCKYANREWRRKRLESLKTDSEMAPPARSRWIRESIRRAPRHSQVAPKRCRLGPWILSQTSARSVPGCSRRASFQNRGE
jgi:hypothetical protein